MNERLTFAQRMALVGASEEKRAAIEEESSLWMVQCTHCGFEVSVWDLGGVRYRARGTKYTYRRCPECDRRRAHKVIWAGDARPGAAQPRASRPSASRPSARLPLWLIVALLLVVGLLASRVFGVALPIWALAFVAFGLRGGRQHAPDGAHFLRTSGCLLSLGITALFAVLSWLLFVVQRSEWSD